MKKWACLVLAGFLLLSCVACSHGGDNDSAATTVTTTAATDAVTATTTLDSASQVATPDAVTQLGVTTKAPSSKISVATTALPIPMDSAQKTDLQNFLNDKANNGFVANNYYDAPEKISLFEVFYDGAGVGTYGTDGWSEQEKKDALAAAGWDDFHVPVLKLPKKGVERVLQEKLGLSLQEIEDDMSEHYHYVQAYDAYYTMHGDTNYSPVTIIKGFAYADGTYLVDYKSAYSEEERGVLTVRKIDTGYRFISNIKQY